MTELTVIDGERDGESFDQAVARRFSGEFGQQRLSDSAVGRRIGMTQSQLSRRMTAELSFKVSEIEHICNVLGIDRDYILTGARSLPPYPGRRLPLPRVDSNHQPFDLHNESCESMTEPLRPTG